MNYTLYSTFLSSFLLSQKPPEKILFYRLCMNATCYTILQIFNFTLLPYTFIELLFIFPPFHALANGWNEDVQVVNLDVLRQRNRQHKKAFKYVMNIQTLKYYYCCCSIFHAQLEVIMIL